MQASTGNDRSKVAEIARRHGVSENTAMALLDAIRQGGGTMARFDLPELGGSGQWMQGGMVMVGNMFDNDLKARVAALCADLAGLGDGASGSRSAGSGNWWPVDLGSPDSAGSQGGVRYAIFNGAHRLVLEKGGAVTVHDTGDHRISGVSQQQGGTAALAFTSQHGTVQVDKLPVVSGGR
jgi:hypothetical protein